MGSDRGRRIIFQLHEDDAQHPSGHAGVLSDRQKETYLDTVRRNAEKLKDIPGGCRLCVYSRSSTRCADPQFPEKEGEVGLEMPYRCKCSQQKRLKFIKEQVSAYDASVFSLPDFAQKLPHPQFLITLSIDPLGEEYPARKGRDRKTYNDLGIPMDKPIVLQVSRFDKFKDWVS